MRALSVYDFGVHLLLRARGAQSRFVNTSIGRLHTYDIPGGGKLPTVVILHGIGSNAVAFHSLVMALRPRVRRIVLPDAVGHGRSEIPNQPIGPDELSRGVEELLGRVLDEPAYVFGNSLGGGGAVRYALDQPTKVRGLFLSSPAGAWMEGPELQAFLETFRMRRAEQGAAFLRRLYAHPPWFAPLIGDEVRARFDRPFMHQFIDAIRPTHQFAPGVLATLAMPIHLSWGKRERLLPEGHLAYYKKELPPHAEIDEPEGFGHCPHLEAPRELARSVVRFIASAQSRAALASS